MRLMNLIKKTFGRADYIEVIADKFSNKDIPDGFAGGSLSSENILIVTNSELPSEIVEEVLDREETYYSVLYLDGLMNVNDIKDAANNLIGPFTHVINVFYDKKDIPLLNESLFNDNDSMYQLYQWHQEEVDYLVKLNQYATICTVYISSPSIEGNVKRSNVEMCIRGLAEVTANHGMICNGIIANQDIELKELLTTSVFLSSRYGQIMTGEVLKLNLGFGKL